jgi:hypothetical protein
VVLVVVGLSVLVVAVLADLDQVYHMMYYQDLFTI